MDNKLNEIRRKIKFLRAEMLGAEDNIRKRSTGMRTARRRRFT